MPLLNYTTQIEALKTVGEIQGILASHGARSILTEYGGDGSIVALSFKIIAPQGELAFRLPVNHDATLNVLKRQWNRGKVPRRYVDYAQAVRVSWRIIKDWVEAQMAIVETDVVRMEEVFLPYLLVSENKTLFERMTESRFMLPEGKKENG